METKKVTLTKKKSLEPATKQINPQVRKEQTKFFLIRALLPAEEEVDRHTASALLVEITPQLKKMITEAVTLLKGFNRKFGNVDMPYSKLEISIPCDPCFLAPGEADSLMGYDDVQTDRNHYEFDGRTFLESDARAIDSETYKKGEAMWRKNEVRMYTCQMHISKGWIQWVGRYKYRDGLYALSEHIPVKKLL